MPPAIQLIVLAAIALYLIFRLRRVLGTRDGFESRNNKRQGVTIDQPGRVVTPEDPVVDEDVLRHVDRDTDAAKALMEMKRADRNFSIPEFCDGAATAYEWIVTAFASGEVEELEPFLSDDVYETFEKTIELRDRGQTAHIKFVALRANMIRDARFDHDSMNAEITVEFISELISYVLDEDDNVIEGSDTNAKRQRDVWTFARTMGSSNPNWTLVATGQ